MKKLMFSLAALGVFASATLAQAAGWGNVKGKFVIEGSAPAAKKLAIDKDPAVCGVHGLTDESLVVDKNGGIGNVVVGIFIKPGGKKPEVHESYEAALKEKVEFDNTKCRFEPHVGVVRVGQTLVLKNTDTVGHNVKADLTANTPFNDLIPAGGQLEKKFSKEERVPMTASCSIHPWMKGYLVVREDPYVAVSAADGTFEIKNLPAGTWSLRVWQEKSGYVQDVKVNDKAAKWARGVVDVKIEDGKTFDFGEIKVPAKSFDK